MASFLNALLNFRLIGFSVYTIKHVCSNQRCELPTAIFLKTSSIQHILQVLAIPCSESSSGFISDALPPKPKWTTKDMPYMSGKVIIVTGGNSGIGKETVKALLEHNAKVYLAARSRAKAEAAIEELRKETGREAIWLQLDLADLLSIKAAAAEFSSKESELHVLFNNAGVMAPKIEDVTAQGFDLQFGTSVLGVEPSFITLHGHFYFTKLLLPILLLTARRSPDGKVRIVNTSSNAHTGCNKLNHESFWDGAVRRKMSSYSDLYPQSKLANVIFSNELARRYGDQGIVSTSLHPGVQATDLQRTFPKPVKVVMDALVFHPAAMGAFTQLYAGTSIEGTGLNGKYLRPWARIGKASPASDDIEECRKLWKWPRWKNKLRRLSPDIPGISLEPFSDGSSKYYLFIP
ncbi:hypothetical protein D9758_014328 [Tetrapyrgos nigripes]|uniref:NAD(P)-binding protein n=1 Tax=Tetrapyrgos nigripes TaxID=182062 RepID=A0A8H5C9Y7_9AGAR|nr:hypothetical protein D9758_014328 [Tetrapyrgos nigripes]